VETTVNTSVFIYPWDLGDEGFESVFHHVREDMGLNGITIAVSYHAAKLQLPHNPKRLARGTRVYATLRPGYPDCTGTEPLSAKVAALRRCGVEQISFYNYGLMWKCEFGWVAQSLGAGRGVLA
jgi:hypothetical protein